MLLNFDSPYENLMPKMIKPSLFKNLVLLLILIKIKRVYDII